METTIAEAILAIVLMTIIVLVSTAAMAWRPSFGRGPKNWRRGSDGRRRPRKGSQPSGRRRGRRGGRGRRTRKTVTKHARREYVHRKTLPSIVVNPAVADFKEIILEYTGPNDLHVLTFDESAHINQDSGGNITENFLWWQHVDYITLSKSVGKNKWKSIAKLRSGEAAGMVGSAFDVASNGKLHLNPADYIQESVTINNGVNAAEERDLQVPIPYMGARKVKVSVQFRALSAIFVSGSSMETEYEVGNSTCSLLSHVYDGPTVQYHFFGSYKATATALRFIKPNVTAMLGYSSGTMQTRATMTAAMQATIDNGDIKPAASITAMANLASDTYREKHIHKVDPTSSTNVVEGYLDNIVLLTHDHAREVDVTLSTAYDVHYVALGGKNLSVGDVFYEDDYPDEDSFADEDDVDAYHAVEVIDEDIPDSFSEGEYPEDYDEDDEYFDDEEDNSEE